MHPPHAHRSRIHRASDRSHPSSRPARCVHMDGEARTSTARDGPRHGATSTIAPVPSSFLMKQRVITASAMHTSAPERRPTSRTRSSGPDSARHQLQEESGEGAARSAQQARQLPPEWCTLSPKPPAGRRISFRAPFIEPPPASPFGHRRPLLCVPQSVTDTRPPHAAQSAGLQGRPSTTRQAPRDLQSAAGYPTLSLPAARLAVREPCHTPHGLPRRHVAPLPSAVVADLSCSSG